MAQDFFIAVLVSIVVVVLAYRRGSLSRSGALAGLVVGTIIFGFGGWQWGVLLGVFFVSSSWLSHFREDEKKQAAEKFDKGHRRDAGQVLANGGLGGLFALLSVIFPSPIWVPLFVGVMATVTADTWATELGTLSKNPPRLITNGRIVEVGSSGGISLLGLVVSTAGGLVIGLTAGLLIEGLPPAAGAIIGALSGLAGSLFDSLLGATVQKIYYCDHCQKETEQRVHRGQHETRSLRGWSWLNNDLVNLLASAVGAGVALAIWLLLVG